VTVHAYVLVQTDVGKASQVAQQVNAIDGVIVAEAVTGPYDVIARTEAPTMDELGRLVVRDLRQIEGITRTITCPVVKF
jgi:DNA-binding Lrp family transcriptional regulator